MTAQVLLNMLDFRAAKLEAFDLMVTFSFCASKQSHNLAFRHTTSSNSVVLLLKASVHADSYISNALLEFVKQEYQLTANPSYQLNLDEQ